MVCFEGYGYEQNYMGFPIKHAKLKYYSFGTSFLRSCIEHTLKLLIGLFIISVVIFYFFRNITNTPNIYNTSFFYSLNGLLIFIQLFFYSWSYKQELKLYEEYDFNVVDLEAYILSKKENEFFYISSASILTLITVSTYLFVYFYKTIKESTSLDSMFFMLALGFLFIAIQIILTILIISKMAFVDGRFCAKMQLGREFVNKFGVVLLDGNKIEGNILKYYDGIYTLTKYSLQDNTNIDYIIHEDKIQHIERFYKKTDNYMYNTFTAAENEELGTEG